MTEKLRPFFPNISCLHRARSRSAIGRNYPVTMFRGKKINSAQIHPEVTGSTWSQDCTS